LPRDLQPSALDVRGKLLGLDLQLGLKEARKKHVT